MPLSRPNRRTVRVVVLLPRLALGLCGYAGGHHGPPPLRPEAATVLAVRPASARDPPAAARCLLLVEPPSPLFPERSRS